MSKNKKALSRDDRARRTFYWLVLPAFIIFALVIIVPFFLGFYYSLTDWKSVTQTKINFVGLKNFTDSFADTRFQYSLMITVIFALFNVVVVNFVSFGLALLVSSKIKFSEIFRAGFFIPNLIGAPSYYVVNKDTKALDSINKFFADLVDTKEGQDYTVNKANMISAFSTSKEMPSAPLSKFLAEWVAAKKPVYCVILTFFSIN